MIILILHKKLKFRKGLWLPQNYYVSEPRLFQILKSHAVSKHRCLSEAACRRMHLHLMRPLALTFLSEHCGAVWPGLLQSTLCPSDVLSTVDLIMSLLLKASSAFPHLRTHVFGGLLKLDTFISYPGPLCVPSAF